MAECRIDLTGPAANDEKVLELCLHKLARAIFVFYSGQRKAVNRGQIDLHGDTTNCGNQCSAIENACVIEK